MNNIYFENALVLESRFGTSKAGNPYCALNFIDMQTLNVYDVMQFGDAASVAAGCVKGATCNLEFSVVPARQGGVRLDLIGVSKS